jgi:hypothetical protein
MRPANFSEGYSGMKLKIDILTRRVSLHCDTCGKDVEYTPSFPQAAATMTAAMADILRVKSEFCKHISLDFSWVTGELCLYENPKA